MDVENPSKDHIDHHLHSDYFSQSLSEDWPFYKYKNKNKKKKPKRKPSSNLSKQSNDDDEESNEINSHFTSSILPKVIHEDECGEFNEDEPRCMTFHSNGVESGIRKPTKIENHQTIGKVSQR